MPRSRRVTVRRLAVVAVALGLVASVAWTLRPSSSPPGIAGVVTPEPSAVVTSSPHSTAGRLFDGIPPASPSASLPPIPALLAATCDPSAVPGASPVPPADTALALRVRLRVPILMYHRVIDFARAGDSIRSLVVPPQRFSDQMQILAAHGWHTITAAELAADMSAGRTPAPKTFVVSFDDGYDDGYTFALPVLQRFGFVGTFYVIAGRIDHPGDLTVAHIQALVAAGNEIGNHTLDHVDLPRLRPLEMRYEVAAAAERLAEVSGRWPSTFAYPFGGVDNAAVDAVGACGTMRLAVTTVPGADESWGNRFDVPRVRVSPDTTPEALLAELERLGSGPAG